MKVQNRSVPIHRCGFGFMSKERYSIEISRTKGMCFKINVAGALGWLILLGVFVWLGS